MSVRDKNFIHSEMYKTPRKIHTGNLRQHTGHKDKKTTRIDRGTKWGNPFRINESLSREQVISRYFADLMVKFNNHQYAAQHYELRHSDVFLCWCSPEECHGDVLAAVVQVMDEIESEWRNIEKPPVLQKMGYKWFCSIGDIWFESDDLWTVVYHTLSTYQKGVEYPETAKIQSPRDEHIADFIHWLEWNNLVICEWRERGELRDDEGNVIDYQREGYSPVRKTARDFVLEYFDVDKAQQEQELRQMLDKLRNNATDEQNQNTPDD